ncbi:hypothetical protein ACFE04_028957 [Oxalis oulophora]
MGKAEKIGIIGAGIFVRSQYIPRLSEISDLVIIKAIWSRTEESAKAAVEIAQKHGFPQVECKWGDEGLDDIINDSQIPAVAVVLAAQYQVDMSLKLLKAGKHVLQATTEIERALSSYKSICANIPGQPIWAVAENYRFEPAFVESKKLVADIGDMMNIQVIVEGSMNSSNPYFSSVWRRNFAGGFIVDMGVHFIAGLRMLAGCEVISVSAMTSHVDKTLPPPDNITCNFQLENGCPGVFVMVVSCRSPKACRFLHQMRSSISSLLTGFSCFRYSGESLALREQCKLSVAMWMESMVTVFGADGQSKSNFYSFSGVTEELKAFIHDISQATLKKGSSYEAEPRCSFAEGARDVAVLEAMLESGSQNGNLVQVKKL